jgi:acyl carrier protein
LPNRDGPGCGLVKGEKPMNIAQQIKQELAHICMIEPDQIKADAWLIEYGLDSIRSMELVIALEEHFEIELPDEAIARLQTVADVIKLIESQLVKGG